MSQAIYIVVAVVLRPVETVFLVFGLLVPLEVSGNIGPHVQCFWVSQ